MSAQASAELLTVKQAATQLNTSTKAVYDWIHTGQLKAVRLGKRAVRIPHAAIAQFVTPIETGLGGR